MNNMTELVFILDRSGSMHGMEADTVGGFNSLIQKQKQHTGDVLISTILFNNTQEVLYDRVPLKHVPKMTQAQFSVGGCTALLDAIGGAIHHIGNVHKYARKEDRPSRTLFVISTDGYENASRTYTFEKVRNMIEFEKTTYNWEFLFLGANMDAVEMASRFGITKNRAVNYEQDGEGTRLQYSVLSDAITDYRNTTAESATIRDDWGEKIEYDYRTRHRG